MATTHLMILIPILSHHSGTLTELVMGPFYSTCIYRCVGEGEVGSLAVLRLSLRELFILSCIISRS